MRALYTLTLAVVLALGLGGAGLAQTVPVDESTTDDRTPPRLSYVDGQVSFWRPGAPEWVAAQINTALAPGDELSTGSPGNFEVQIGSRAFARGWAGTALGLVDQEPDLLQIKVTSGHASFDLHALDPGRVVEVGTPNAAFTIERPGYYRVTVDGDRTSFVARRGGRATVTPASGQAAAVATDEEVLVEGIDAPRVASYAAPPLDAWDRWNDARTDYLADSASARYVSAGVYGASDLDRHGRWRVVPEYGSVWVPTSVAPDWVPYSTGSWTWDPYYGWTWVDTAPWGWAPFHYGRWVFVDRHWAWAPGPVIVRPAYAPALVAFFGGGGPSVRVGWVALGWGEPVVPWWGRPRFVGVPWWGGWGGPRVVNNVVVDRRTMVNVQNITVYRNTRVHNAVVAVDHQRFGRGSIQGARVAQVDARSLRPVQGRLGVDPVPASLTPTTVRGVRPPDNRRERPVVATRPPERRGDAEAPQQGQRAPITDATPSPRLVPAPRATDAAVVPPRPPSGQGRSERPQPSPPARQGTGRPQQPDVSSAPAPQAPVLRPQGPGQAPRATAPTPGPSAAPRQAPPAPRMGAPRPEAMPLPDTGRSQGPAPRMEAPRARPAPRVDAPRPQAPAPAVAVPRSQGPAPRADVPRTQGPGPRMEAPRAQPAPRVDGPRPPVPAKGKEMGGGNGGDAGKGRQ